MACLPASLCRRAKGPWSANSGGHWTRAVLSGEPKEGGGRGYGGGGCDGVAPSEQQPGSGSRRDRAVTYTPPHVPSEPSAGQITAHNAVRSGGKERHAETRSAGSSVVILFEAMAVSPGERRTAPPRQILSGTSEPPRCSWCDGRVDPVSPLDSTVSRTRDADGQSPSVVGRGASQRHGASAVGERARWDRLGAHGS